MLIMPPAPPVEPSALALTAPVRPAVVAALTVIEPPAPPAAPTALALKAAVTVTEEPVEVRL